MSTVSEPLGSICSACTEQTPLRSVNRDPDDDHGYDGTSEGHAVLHLHEFA